MQRTCSSIAGPSGDAIAGDVATLTPCDLTLAPASVTVDLVSALVDNANETATMLDSITRSDPRARYALVVRTMSNSGAGRQCAKPLRR